MAILRKKEELDGLERYHIPDEVMQYIANNIKSNIRELEGSLNKLIALSNPGKRNTIDIPLAAEALKDMISPDEYPGDHTGADYRRSIRTLQHPSPC